MMWQPHTTIQNKVSRLAADTLLAALMEKFRPHTIEIIGLDLWRHLGGPWQRESSAMFGQDRRKGSPWHESELSGNSAFKRALMSFDVGGCAPVQKRKSLP